jgi:histidinol dehydrogenase
MNILRYPERESWPGILRRPRMNYRDLEQKVMKIIEEVADQGDPAVRAYTREFDGVDLDALEVSRDEIRAASGTVNDTLKQAIEEAQRNIRTFHGKQIPRAETVVTTPGVRCWQKPVPIDRVGLYVPGGSAPLLSTVLMLGIPAKIAGCREVVLCSPPDRKGRIHPSILYCAGLLGIDRVFRVGGAQAIAAMAHGTGTLPAVDKIFGPGNRYVTMAKQIVSRETVAIDMPAGPSELAVVADARSNPAFIASDLLSQAEHGPDSQVLLLTDSDEMIAQVRAELESQLKELPRRDMVNLYAPEHLILACGNCRELADRVVNAGSVFLGDYSPESAGDYASGTNHTLPTHGWARAFSGVNMDSFYKKITFQEISRKGLMNLGETVMTMAAAEQLQAHSHAVSIRLKSKADG